ncbi:uncharacterized protein LOC110022079 isoform X2 [Phalaenopsis equestris]|uniref:uncharacterized protein LOC110022079 isoform X2 n=1 Tax=Phalaenopsis equestris TaxID=78828 RepID=UPI0009E40CDD|nr:uncharacterized protein LOC110022079 isoform X2 [Phalaenopsis equestris]
MGSGRTKVSETLSPNEVQEGYEKHVYREFQLTELNRSNKEKKRKRRDSVVEGFNVFKSSKSLKTSDARSNLEDDSVLHRKEVEKQIEVGLEELGDVVRL